MGFTLRDMRQESVGFITELGVSLWCETTEYGICLVVCKRECRTYFVGCKGRECGVPLRQECVGFTLQDVRQESVGFTLRDVRQESVGFT